MNIEEATEKYEAWLAKRIRLLKADLALRHKSMREGVFPFLRSLGTGKEGRLRLDPEGIPGRAGGRGALDSTGRAPSRVAGAGHKRNA